jgi:hypothetical protein
MEKKHVNQEGALESLEKTVIADNQTDLLIKLHWRKRSWFWHYGNVSWEVEI